MQIFTMLIQVDAYGVGVFVVVAPLVEDEEYQPPKQTHQEQHLRNELNKDVDETLEVAKEIMIHLCMKVIFIYINLTCNLHMVEDG